MAVQLDEMFISMSILSVVDKSLNDWNFFALFQLRLAAVYVFVRAFNPNLFNFFFV